MINNGCGYNNGLALLLELLVGEACSKITQTKNTADENKIRRMKIKQVAHCMVLYVSSGFPSNSHFLPAKDEATFQKAWLTWSPFLADMRKEASPFSSANLLCCTARTAVRCFRSSVTKQKNQKLVKGCYEYLCNVSARWRKGYEYMT